MAQTSAALPKRTAMPKRTIGARIRALREQRGLSQTQLARKLGTLPQNMWQIETGTRGITVQQLILVARALDVSMDDILGQSRRTRSLAPLPSSSRRLVRRMQRIQALPPEEQDAVLKLLDGALTIRGRRNGKS
jgi:transcriptional regulator with XRE-family HTH domain